MIVADVAPPDNPVPIFTADQLVEWTTLPAAGLAQSNADRMTLRKFGQFRLAAC